MPIAVPEPFRRRSETSPWVPSSCRSCSRSQPMSSSRAGPRKSWRQGHTEASRGAPAAVPRRSQRSRFAPELLPDRSMEAVSAGRGGGSQNHVLGRRSGFGVERFWNVRACGLYGLLVLALAPARVRARTIVINARADRVTGHAARDSRPIEDGHLARTQHPSPGPAT